MKKEQFQEKIQEEISPNLYLEETDFEDLDRVMYTYEGKKPIYVCAFPRSGVREEFSNDYLSARGAPFPNREQIENKIKYFIDDLPNSLDLYE